jgi:hypothetical protein
MTIEKPLLNLYDFPFHHEMMMEQLLDQFLHYLVVEKGLSKNTIEAYSHGLNRFLNHLRKKGIQEIREVGKFDVRGFLLVLKKKNLSAKTIVRHPDLFPILNSRGNPRNQSHRGLRITQGG